MIRSVQFDDIYFSPEDGLAETEHVFLRGNNLPAAWQDRSSFTIAETGFGTGLNFLAAWKLFEETAPVAHQLDYVSFEKYPLSSEEILTALRRWQGYFGGRLEKMAALYPLRINGVHRVHLTPRTRLTLIFDDVNEALPRLIVPRGVNAWFLDGFAPAKNPQMWSDVLFDGMARLSAEGATVASFTAAGHVRRGLAAREFTVSKVRGYGRKRDMTQAVFNRSGASAAADGLTCAASARIVFP
ncbi:MAG: tRNA (5-methylaminomethyl-2-thiouridine)(34)-methyltransferase MnmD [Micavibrio aeruginosavorus]|uniref:tRNA (5-methylaminomethyl-2-thiouridine)(34)-methyltransferase MnmD n=1 Tax=Micavibrio aeruginosavorus TaxID=349221 RepID=A0A7T5R3L8_9BACT|nr:MAG: tRNA (5-methylaminomethyl-2-thiouridine)(34)-methyltransferase MnmD [Micavibrio aeruginosavorus]